MMEPSTAFVCPGECKGVTDRPHHCGSSTCTFRRRPLQPTPALYICRQPGGCGQRQDTPGVCTSTECSRHGQSLLAFVACLECGPEAVVTCPHPRFVLDVSQLPAVVHATHLDGGPMRPGGKPKPAPLYNFKPDQPLASHIPNWENSAHPWAGRSINFQNVRLFHGGQSQTPPCGPIYVQPVNRPPNALLVAPGEVVTIDFEFRTEWRYNPNDYCPGCIVQLYVGLGQQFSLGLVEYGISQSQGRVQFTFRAPSDPGVYFIQNSITLEYNFVKKGVGNAPGRSIAVLRVANHCPIEHAVEDIVQDETVKKWWNTARETIPNAMIHTLSFIPIVPEGLSLKNEAYAGFNTTNDNRALRRYDARRGSGLSRMCEDGLQPYKADA